MKRKFQATVTYDIVIDDPGADNDPPESSVSGLHIMDVVYAAQVGDVQGLTGVKSSGVGLAYVAEEVSMSWKETT